MAALTVVEGSSNPPLYQAVRAALGVGPGGCRCEVFPDGERRAEVTENLRGDDVYILQSTPAPVGEHLLELLTLADACRRAGAARITAVSPYWGNARQDRRRSGRESLGARLVADVLGTRVDRVVAVDLHTPAIEGCFHVPLEHLSAVELLADAARPAASDGVEAVVVSPDLGGVKLAERYAARLGLPLAIVHKTRLSGAVVQAQGVVGEVSGKAPIIVDDMVTTGATLEAAAQVLLEHGAVARLTVVATHGLLVGPALRRLTQLGVERLVTTDSVKAPDAPGALPLQRVSLGPLLAEAIRRLHQGKPLFDLSSQL